jgi:hypothetical protein
MEQFARLDAASGAIRPDDTGSCGSVSLWRC